MRFTQPAYLLLLVPVLAGLFYSYRHVHGMAKARKRLSFALRALLVLLIVGALSGPEARRKNEGLCTIFLIDRSDSISDADKAKAEKFLAEVTSKLGPNDVAGVVAFGKEPAVDATPGGRRTPGPILTTVNPAGTDLAAAIRLASASFTPGKARRIVVLSDGNETSGDALGAAQVAASDGITVDFMPLGREARAGEATVLGLDAPDETRTDQPFELRATIESSVDQAAVVDVDRDGVLIGKQSIQLHTGVNHVVLSDTLKDPGFHRYRATLHATRDRDTRNNVGMAFVAVKGRPRILVMQGQKVGNELAQALQRGGVAVDVVHGGGIPTHPEDYQVYDAVVINDLNASELSRQQMTTIQAAIRDSGVGFAMVGGENAYLPGGYYNTPIAEALPVDLNIRQRKSFPSTSICIIVDASGSMGMEEDGIRKIRLAAQAAEDTVKMMSHQDRVGVAGSTDGIEFVAPMQKLEDKEAVIAQIRRLNTGGGGIYVEPSVEKAEAALMNEPSKVRHFILMADGSDCDTQEGTLPLIMRMRSNHITTSVVSIGDGKDVGFLRQVAAAGGGRFYLAKKASQLPAITTQDASIMSRSAIEEGAFLPKLSRSDEILKGIDSTPPLLAYCLTESRPLARVGMLTGKDDPLLATWQYGLGTSLAFTSDAQSRWASRWVGWPGFSTFWAQAGRAISRRAALNDYQVAVKHDGAKGRIEMKAYDRLGNPITESRATVRVSTPRGGFRDVALAQEAPGVYSGRFDADELGSYIVTVAEPDPRGGQRVSSSGFSIPYPPEYRAYRTNLPLLSRMASLTGGRELSAPTQALRPVKNPGESITELWALLLFVCAFLLPIDIGVRRIALPIAEMWAKVRAKLKRKPVVIAQTETVGRLHAAKQRARQSQDPSEPVKEVAMVEAPRPSREPVASGKSSKPGTTASSLLEAKRKRRDD